MIIPVSKIIPAFLVLRLPKEPTALPPNSLQGQSQLFLFPTETEISL